MIPDDAVYEPIPGVPGDTLDAQYHAARRMIRDGDITQRQVDALLAKVEQRYPDSDLGKIEEFTRWSQDVADTFMHPTFFSDQEREALLWRWATCACPGCLVMHNFFSNFAHFDGRVKDPPEGD